MRRGEQGGPRRAGSWEQEPGHWRGRLRDLTGLGLPSHPRLPPRRPPRCGAPPPQLPPPRCPLTCPCPAPQTSPQRFPQRIHPGEPVTPLNYTSAVFALDSCHPVIYPYTAFNCTLIFPTRHSSARICNSSSWAILFIPRPKIAGECNCRWSLPFFSGVI